MSRGTLITQQLEHLIKKNKNKCVCIRIQFIQVEICLCFLTKMYEEAATFPRAIVYMERGCLPDELLEDMLRTLYSFLISSLMSRLAEHNNILAPMSNQYNVRAQVNLVRT